MIRITPTIRLHEDELRFQFKLASGPGGQNVNKVATAAELRFDVAASPGLPEAVRTRLLALAGSRATQEGELLITARQFLWSGVGTGSTTHGLERLALLAGLPTASRHCEECDCRTPFLAG